MSSGEVFVLKFEIMSMSTVTADLAFEIHSIPHTSPYSCFEIKDHIHVGSAAFPESSVLTTSPLEMIIAAQDHPYGHKEKFVFPIKSSSDHTIPLIESDPKPHIVPDKILQVWIDCFLELFRSSISAVS